MSAVEKNTRKDKYEKRRKNTKMISTLLVVGAILMVALISIWLFGGGNSELESEQEKVNENNREEQMTQDKAPVETDGNEEESELTSEDHDENLETDLKEVEPSDENVLKAYEGNWPAIGTEQQGVHTVNYSEGSQDRIEMTRAILLATGLSEDNYREWWIANGGEQKVVATVSDNEETEIYRVFLSWMDGEGWKPTKLEKLKENDWEKYK